MIHIVSRIVYREDGYHIFGENGKHLGGPYSKEHAEKRLKDIEMFKHMKKASGDVRLWLDDVRLMPADYNLWAKTAQEAIDAVDKGNVGHISFDHDLGAIAGQRELTGYDVAKHIEQGAFNLTVAPMTWEVHSQNPAGADRIRVAMEAADRFWNQTRAALGGRNIMANEQDNQLEMGLSVEMEHLKTIKILIQDVLNKKDIEISDYVKKIAEDHLREDPLYYSKLKSLNL